MLMALIAKNKAGLLKENTKPNANDPKLNAWVRCNNMVLSWIINSMSKPIASSIIFIETAEEVGRELIERLA